MRAERARGVSDDLYIDRDAITTREDLIMAAEAYQRGCVAVKENGWLESWKEGWKEGWREGWHKGLQEGARDKEVDILCELLLPAVGREFADELRALLDDDELRARLDPNLVFDLRLRYDPNPAGLRQAIRDRLGQA